MHDSERITIPTVFHNELEELTVYWLMPVYLHLQYWQNIAVSVVSCQSNTSTVVPLISQIQAKHTQMSSRVSDIQPIPSMACENFFTPTESLLKVLRIQSVSGIFETVPYSSGKKGELFNKSRSEKYWVLVILLCIAVFGGLLN